MCIKGHSKQSEKETHGMGQAFASHIADKEFISRIYKEFLLPNNTNTPIEKLVKGLQHFSKEDVQMANEHRKREAQ